MGKNTKKKTAWVVYGALIGAAYVLLTYASNAIGIAYGVVQFRLSEALTVLPVFSPFAAIGLVIGCAISNLTSPLGIADVIFGTAATAAAGIATWYLRKIKIKGFPWLSFLMPPVINGLIVGSELFLFADPSAQTTGLFLLNFCQIAFGEAVVIGFLGVPLYSFAKNRKIFEK